MQLIPCQKNAVNNLMKAYKNMNNEKMVLFKAPTGSGKTFMASEFISRVFQNEFELGNEKVIFVVATISSADLPRAFAKKLNEYKKYHEFQNYDIEYIKSPSSNNKKLEDIQEFNLENRKVFVFGVSSFGKNTLFYQNNTLDNFLKQIKLLGYKLIFIRDEAHIGRKESINKETLKNFDEKMNENSNFIMKMSATLKDNINLVEIKNSDMNADDFYLLKTSLVQTKLSGEITNEEIIDDALDTFIKIKKEYENIQTNKIIRPAILIQLINDADIEKNKIKNQEFKEGLEILEKKLIQKGLIYLKYLGNDKSVVGSNLPNTLEYASEMDSMIDVIIFKVGPATGWDIPRANMLLQLRNVSSESLNIQTLGRIMRNSYPELKKNDVTDKYYVWSNYQKSTRDQAYYKLKEKFKDEKFFYGKINIKSKQVIKDEEKYINDMLNFLNSKEFLNKIKDFDTNNDLYYNIINYGQAYVKNKIENIIYLKIYNLKRKKEEMSFNVQKFENKIKEIAIKENKNIEIIWYIFFSFINKIKEIKNQNSKWIQNSDSYEIFEDAKTKDNYSIFIDNNDNPKVVDTKNWENYGYIQLKLDENEKYWQYLDSTPEKNFYDEFNKIISSKQKNKIKFFSKMPTLGSEIYFEYFSKENANIAKSFMDFAIKYENKLLMIEVKSKDADYNPTKTQELLDAYKMYMQKFDQSNLILMLYEYDSKNKTNAFQFYENGEWKDNESFRDAFDNFLN